MYGGFALLPHSLLLAVISVALTIKYFHMVVSRHSVFLFVNYSPYRFVTGYFVYDVIVSTYFLQIYCQSTHSTIQQLINRLQ